MLGVRPKLIEFPGEESMPSLSSLALCLSLILAVAATVSYFAGCARASFGRLSQLANAGRREA